MINWIVSSSVLILVVVALRFLLRGKISLRLQYALWGIVLLRLLMPFEIGTSDVSLMNAVEQMPVVQEFESLQGMESISYSEQSGEVLGNQGWDEGQWPLISENKTAEEFQRMERELQMRDVAAAVWKWGIAVMLVLFAWVNTRFAKELEENRQRIEMEGVSLPVYVTDAAETPCLFGLFKPAIYVTSEAASDETVLHHTIEHETTHYLHKDHIWSFLRCIALAIHWYNPLVWLAEKLSKADGELACDEATIGRIGEGERYAYGQTLIEMTKPGQEILLGMATTMTGSKSTLKERIELIAKKPKMAAYTLAAVVVIAAVAAVCTFTGAKENGDFLKWVQTVTPEDMVYAQAYNGAGLTQMSYVLTEEDKAEIAEILNALTEEQLSLKDEGKLEESHKLLIAEGSSESYDGEFLLHCYGDGSVAVTFDSDTAKNYGQIGKTWWIDSMDLATSVFAMVNSWGTGMPYDAELMNADVDADGREERISVTAEDDFGAALVISEADGTVIWEEYVYHPHTGREHLLLYDDGERTCLLRYVTYVHQGYADYQYYMFHIKDGEAVLLEEDRVGFEYYADSTLTPEIGRFLEKVNGYLENSVLLLSSQMNGSVSEMVIGPTSSQKLMDANRQLLERMKKAEAESMDLDVVQAMKRVKESDFVRFSDAGNVSARQLADALNGAADEEISEEAAIGFGYDTDSFAYYWIGGAYLEKESDLWISNDDLHFELEGGLTSNVVKVCYGTSAGYDTGYFYDRFLYETVKHSKDIEDVIDAAALEQYGEILEVQMKKNV